MFIHILNEVKRTKNKNIKLTLADLIDQPYNL